MYTYVHLTLFHSVYTIKKASQSVDAAMVVCRVQKEIGTYPKFEQGALNKVKKVDGKTRLRPPVLLDYWLKLDNSNAFRKISTEPGLSEKMRSDTSREKESQQDVVWRHHWKQEHAPKSTTNYPEAPVGITRKYRACVVRWQARIIRVSVFHGIFGAYSRDLCFCVFYIPVLLCLCSIVHLYVCNREFQNSTAMILQ